MFTHENHPTYACEKSHDRSHRAAGVLLLLGVLLFLAICVGFCLQFADAERQAQRAGDNRVRGASLHGTIMHLDEVLTMSARMAVATGDRDWELRYRKFEPTLDATIKEAMALETTLGLVPDSAKTDEANQKLVAFEHHAFGLVASNRLAEARAVLFSDEYEREKKIYADGMTAMLGRLQKNLTAAATRRTRASRLVLISGNGVLIASFLLCVLVIGRLRISQFRLTQAVNDREQAHEIARQREAQLQAVFDHTPACMYVKDTDGRVVVRNRRAKDLITGLGVRWDGCADGLRPVERQVLEAGLAVEFEESVALSDGGVLALWAIGFPLFDGNSRASAVCVIALDVTKRKEAEVESQNMQRQLVEASRQAGMAEVATGVLHNVGNVLNSVNVSATLVVDQLRKSRIDKLVMVSSLLTEHQDDLVRFLLDDPQGRQIPAYLLRLSDHLSVEQSALVKEMQTLKGNIDHIKQIVVMQQSYAKVSGAMEALAPVELVEDALRMSAASPAQGQVEIVREFDAVPPVLVDRHKVLQILVNLIDNAKQALDPRPEGRHLTLRITTGPASTVRMEVADNGVGILPENLTRIFNHGFTTKKTGHGFGLHSGANAAREMGGSLAARSEGSGRGATFTLELPLAGGKELAKAA